MNKLNNNGYLLNKKKLGVDKLIKLKEDLTVVARFHEDYQEEPNAIAKHIDVALTDALGHRDRHKPYRVPGTEKSHG